MRFCNIFAWACEILKIYCYSGGNYALNVLEMWATISGYEKSAGMLVWCLEIDELCHH